MDNKKIPTHIRDFSSHKMAEVKRRIEQTKYQFWKCKVFLRIFSLFICRKHRLILKSFLLETEKFGFLSCFANQSCYSMIEKVEL